MESYCLALQIRIFIPFFYVFASVVPIGGFISLSQRRDRAGLSMPGGGWEMHFPDWIPPEFLKVVR